MPKTYATLTKRFAAALGKVFSAEIGGGLQLHQSKAKVFREMADDGLVVEETVTLGGRFPVAVTGWSLTHRGRLLYCELAARQERVNA